MDVLGKAWQHPPDDGHVRLWWLGQAGFGVQYGRCRLLIDPYLSDSLAEKYHNTRFPHVREMPIPVMPESLSGITAVLCTHAHSDHMDPGTLPVIARNNPECSFVVPAAACGRAMERGIPENRLRPAVAEQSFTLGNVRITALPSAHERRETDAKRRDLFLGYGLLLGGQTIYHSGDCVPFPELAGLLTKLRVGLALLPVNGRDELRCSNGVPGNFTFAEAVDLCRTARIPRFVAHHWGMFSFNTLSIDELTREAARIASGVQCIVPEIGRPILLEHD